MSATLPMTIHDFIKRQTTVPVAELRASELEECPSPYASYWYRAVVCILLSGRVNPKADGLPNKTDVNRICKEANFNQYLFERVARFLVGTEVIQVNRQDKYERWDNYTEFWEHDTKALPQVARWGVLKIVQERTGFNVWRPVPVLYSNLIEFLVLFFGCFKGLALHEEQVGKAFYGFATLPERDLVRAAKEFNLKASVVNSYNWKHWLDDKGQSALVSALYAAEWMFYEEKDRTAWVYASPTGLGMLGLAKIPPVAPLSTDLKVLPNHCIFAGAGLEMDKLECLFRYCRIKRIDQVFEFQLDRRRLVELPSKTSPGEELREVLKELEPLPVTVADLLGTKSKLGGVLSMRWCSALVKPETPEALSALREHPKLKGYLEAGGPPGYLLIKSSSNPENFARRCHELGFEVKLL